MIPRFPKKIKIQTVLLLLGIIKQQGELSQQLKDEIARLKGHNSKSKIHPRRFENNKSDKEKQKGEKRPGSQKSRKTAKLQIHDTILVEPENIPQNSVFKGYNDFIVQGLKIEAHNIRYRLKTYEAPDGKYICAELPQHLNGKHFGPELVTFILYQYYYNIIKYSPIVKTKLEFRYKD